MIFFYFEWFWENIGEIRRDKIFKSLTYNRSSYFEISRTYFLVLRDEVKTTYECYHRK